MRTRCSVFFLAVALAVPALGSPPLSLDQAMEFMAQPGSWIEAAGDLQPDGTLLAKEVEIYSAADSAETEEAAIYGAAVGVNVAGGSLKVLGYTVLFDAQTTLKDENKQLITSARLRDGIGVKVQGSLKGNGALVATKIKLQGVKPGKSSQPKEKVFGPVTVLDARSHSLRVMNTPIKLRPDATVWKTPSQ